MFWYRASMSLGRPSIVGTTVKSPELLPDHLTADEKHTRLQGKKAYVATTVGAACILGAEITLSASGDALTESYGKFAEEARDIDPEYQPKTVCVDPWQATRQAWTTLFSNVSIILCFLHSILKIRKCSDVLKGLRSKLIGKGWHAYQARTKRQFSQRVRRLLEWSESHLPAGPLLDAARAISFKRGSFKAVYDFDNPHRTTST